MDPRYSPFDPLCWLIFAGFLVSMILIVKTYHRKYPGYPEAFLIKEKLSSEDRPSPQIEGDAPAAELP
jgi:hypothetical protein